MMKYYLFLLCASTALGQSWSVNFSDWTGEPLTLELTSAGYVYDLVLNGEPQAGHSAAEMSGTSGGATVLVSPNPVVLTDTTVTFSPADFNNGDFARAFSTTWPSTFTAVTITDGSVVSQAVDPWLFTAGGSGVWNGSTLAEVPSIPEPTNIFFLMAAMLLLVTRTPFGRRVFRHFQAALRFLLQPLESLRLWLGFVRQQKLRVPCFARIVDDGCTKNTSNLASRLNLASVKVTKPSETMSLEQWNYE